MHFVALGISDAQDRSPDHLPKLGSEVTRTAGDVPSERSEKEGGVAVCADEPGIGHREIGNHVVDIRLGLGGAGENLDECMVRLTVYRDGPGDHHGHEADGRALEILQHGPLHGFGLCGRQRPSFGLQGVANPGRSRQRKRGHHDPKGYHQEPQAYYDARQRSQRITSALIRCRACKGVNHRRVGVVMLAIGEWRIVEREGIFHRCAEL